MQLPQRYWRQARVMISFSFHAGKYIIILMILIGQFICVLEACFIIVFMCVYICIPMFTFWFSSFLFFFLPFFKEFYCYCRMGIFRSLIRVLVFLFFYWLRTLIGLSFIQVCIIKYSIFFFFSVGTPLLRRKNYVFLYSICSVI